MARKQNKTEHVLNIISGHQEDAPETQAADASASAAAIPNAPIMDMTGSQEEALAEKIHDSLSQELEGALTPEQAPAAVTPPPAAEKVSAAPPAPVIESEIQPSVKAESLPLPSSVRIEDQWIYVNIMQALVENKAEKMMGRLGLCTCSRCSADVKALALSNLPPKYAVTDKNNEIPLLTVYEGRYNAELTAQLIHACECVSAHPRHDD